MIQCESTAKIFYSTTGEDCQHLLDNEICLNDNCEALSSTNVCVYSLWSDWSICNCTTDTMFSLRHLESGGSKCQQTERYRICSTTSHTFSGSRNTVHRTVKTTTTQKIVNTTIGQSIAHVPSHVEPARSSVSVL